MTTTRLYLIRHGQSTSSTGIAPRDPAHTPLTDLGQRQSRALAQWLDLRPTAVLTSRYDRARDTAMPLCERWQITPGTHPLLHEFITLSPAAVAGSTPAIRQPLEAAYWAACNPHARHGADAETFTEFADRVHTARHTLAELADGTLLFGHGMWFAMLLWQIQELGGWGDTASMRAFLRYQQALPMPNCAVYQISRLHNNTWAVRFDQALYRRIRDAGLLPGDVMGGA